MFRFYGDTWNKLNMEILRKDLNPWTQLCLPFLYTLRPFCKGVFSKRNYSQLSLSQLHLSRITAYLKVKIWSLFKHENLTTGNNTLWKRGETALKGQLFLFSTFSIYLFKSQISPSFVKCGVDLFFAKFCKSDVSRYGYLEVFQRVPWTSR